MANGEPDDVLVASVGQDRAALLPQLRVGARDLARRRARSARRRGARPTRTPWRRCRRGRRPGGRRAWPAAQRDAALLQQDPRVELIDRWVVHGALASRTGAAPRRAIRPGSARARSARARAPAASRASGSEQVHERRDHGRSSRSGGWRPGRRRCRRGSTRRTAGDRSSAGRRRTSWSRRRPDGAPGCRAGRCSASRFDSSWATSYRFMCCPEPVGHSTLNDVAVIRVHLDERADEQGVHGRPDRPPPVRVAAEHARVRLGREVADPELLRARVEDVRVVVVIAGQRTDPVIAQELRRDPACASARAGACHRVSSDSMKRPPSPGRPG